MAEAAEKIKNDTFHIFSEIRQDLESEWEGDEPSVNFFLLLGVLLALIIYLVFITFYFSRVIGAILGYVVTRFLRWRNGSSYVKVHIGSFSISILSGKIMIRNFSYTNNNLSFHINDGWIIFSYWRPVPKKCPPSRAMNSSRLHISLNGVKVHIYNRLDLYQLILKSAGQTSAAAKLAAEIGEDPAAAAAAQQRALRHQPPPDKIDEWWDNFWRLSGMIKLDISSGRIICGNHLMPTSFATVFEDLKSRIFLSDASNKQDRFMLKAKTTMENVRVSLVKTTGYSGASLYEDPPRIMGDGFAILQSASIHFYYHQDLLGVNLSDIQSQTEDVPVWESVWRLDNNTVFSYGPWADKQRTVLWSFFFPSDYGTAPITEMPKKGQRRIYLQHDVRLSLLKDAALDIWFMRTEELNSVHTGVQKGSLVEFNIPFITKENGFSSNIKGCLLCIDSTTSLPLRNFITCETLRFNFNCHYPRTYNHHQKWDVSLEFHKISMWIVWDHKRFFVDLINEWSSDSTADLCTFVPYTVYVNLNVLDKFEVILLLNDKNWIDTSSSAGAENLLAAIVGTQLGASFALPFTDFAPIITPFDFEMNASDNLALRVKVPPQFATEPVFTALTNSAHYRSFMEKSSIAVGLSDDWIELYRTETIGLKCNFLFHPIPAKVVSDLPERATNQWLPKLAQHPAQLEPDKLKMVVDIGASEVFVSGLVVKMILDLKDNYFGYYDQISDVSNKPLHSARTKTQQQLSPEYYRPMSAELVVKIQNIRGHCLLHSQKMNAKISDICPIVFTEQISVELKKHHGECLVQALLGPTIVYFPPSVTFPGVNDGWVTLSAFQFRGHGLYSDVDVPWEVEIVEYGWLMELILGDLTSKVHPGQLIEVAQFLDSTILLIINPDEKLEVPDRLDLCQHFENIRLCRQADLHITDVQGRKQNCESSEILKYKLVRVSVDSCNLLITDDKAAIKINTNRLHFCFCNAHAGSFCENVIIQIPLLKCKQLLHVPERKIWLECGFAKIHEVSLDFRLPCPEAQLYVLEERKIFLNKHDKPQPRLYFLWEKGTKNCGCVGSTRFFAEKDKTGPQFIVTATNDLAIPRIVSSPLEQPGFFQSIIYPESYGIQLSASNILLSATESSNTLNNPAERKASTTSTTSFHSVKSGTSSLNATSAIDYAAFLENYDILFSIAGMPQLNEHDDVSRWIAKNRIKVKKISDGITDIQMIKKEVQSTVSTPVGGPQGAGKLLQKAATPKKNNDFESITSDADWGKDYTAIYGRGKASDKVNVFISPLALEATESFIKSINGFLRSLHPAYIVQSIYSSCSSQNHAQPLTSTIIKKPETFFRTPSLHFRITLPQLHIAAFQCDTSGDISSQHPFIHSVLLLSLERSTLNSSTTKPNDDKKISIELQLQQGHAQIMHIVQNERYDPVYNKIPVNYTTNWTDLAASKRVANDAKLKAIFDLHIPDISCRLAVCNLLKKNATTAQMDRLEVDIASIQIISVLGKPIVGDDRSNEASFYEVLAPSINAWIYNIFKFSKELTIIQECADEWRDLTMIRLLAEALDWHDEQVPMPEKNSVLADVKLYHRHFSSCPSCKLMLILMKYVTQKDNLVEADYYSRTAISARFFDSAKTRKLAMMALLSHWQTIICNQIQLADHTVADKYKCMPDTHLPPVDIPADASPEGNAVDEVEKSKDEKEKTTEMDTLLPTNGGTNSADVEKGISPPETNANIPKSKPPLSRGSTSNQFQPGHRRGPSTATNMSVGANENQKMDLYHWVLNAHKEYKEKREAATSSHAKKQVVEDVNAMELLLSVFFWSVFEERKLESSRLDSLPEIQFGLIYNLNLDEIKLDVIEKKLLLSPRNEMLVALTCHHLMNLEAFETSGKFSYEVRLDDLQLKPIHTIMNFNYESKITNIRIVVALASVSFINDITMTAISCQAAVEDISKAFKKSASRSPLLSPSVITTTLDPRTPSPITPSATPITRTESEWTSGVLDKLYDYQRSPFNAQRQDLIQTKIQGQWHIKTVLLESVLTDLILSMNFMKIDCAHEHSRDDYSTLPKNPTKSPALASRRYSFAVAPSTSTSKLNPILDHCTISLKRASLIVSEHVGSNRGAVETRRILNCSLRESNVLFERTRESERKMAIRNFLRITLGEIEGDLPMHAQSIHEVVLRHGPQLNEQLHRIVSQPQPFHPNLQHTVSINEEPITAATSMTSVVSSPEPLTVSSMGTRKLLPAVNSSVGFSPMISKPPTGKHLRQPSIQPFANPASTPIAVEFELNVTGLELNAMLLPSLKAKYRLEKAVATGMSGKSAKFTAEIHGHQFMFQVVKPATPGTSTGPTAPIDTFTLPLPKIKAIGTFVSAEIAAAKSPELLHRYRNPLLTFRRGGYFDIELVVGKMEYVFSTDLLNQILFAEQSFRSELTFLLEKLSVERPRSINESSPFTESAPFLFNLNFHGDGEPWLQLTASTPSRTAIRFTVDGPNATVTNRLTLIKVAEDDPLISENAVEPSSGAPEQLIFGKATVQVNVKLGQLFKTAMYEEAPEELSEVATFMTNISAQNEESSHMAPHNYVISLNRPILLLKSTALDKAILLWLNYRNVHNYWREERQKLLAQNRPKTTQKLSTTTSELKVISEPISPQPKKSQTATSSNTNTAAAAPTTTVTDMNLNLSLSIQNGLYVCVPLYSADLSDNLAALVISLQKSDVTVHIKKELACNANFDGFRITFIDNFDEHSLREPWMQDNSDTVPSNFFYFPHGSYKLCSSAYSPKSDSESAKWYLSVKSEMKGMIIDFDPKIGKLMSLLAHTLSSLGSHDEGGEEYAPSEFSTALLQPDVETKHEDFLDDETSKEFRQVVGHENKVRWLERKLHEQSMLVADLNSYGASAPSIEVERRKLRVLELMRFKEFRQTMLEKLKRKATAVGKGGDKAIVDDTTTARLPSSSFLQTPGNVSKRGSIESHTGSNPEGDSSGNEKENGNNKTIVAGGEESVDINIDVQVNIASGQCILRANPTFQNTGLTSNATQTSLALTKRPSARDLKAKAFAATHCITKLAIPSVDVKVFYTSNDATAATPETIKSIFKEQMRQQKRAKNNCFYLALELASMPEETLVTPLLADFLEQVIEPLPESLFETAKPESDVSSGADTPGGVPIVAIDTSSLPLDVLFHMIVQSSTIRFEGQQQRASAADCLLKLPRLALMASTRKFNEQTSAVGGIYLSATLSAFSLNVYSPHQQATAHDALSLTLDKLSITASRTKTPSEEEKNKVQLVIVCNVGAANFNYDMRRLSELLTFPKPWYRKVLVRRLFFGDQSMPIRAASLSQSSELVTPTSNRISIIRSSTPKTPKSSQQQSSPPIEWAASCVFTMQWKELNVNAQMSNTMGNTTLHVRQGLLRGHLHISPKRYRDMAVTFKLLSSQLNAQGGAISGEVAIAKLLISIRHKKLEEKAPENTAKLEFKNIESRIEWMSRPIFIAKFVDPQIILSDEWRYNRDGKDIVTESTCLINVAGSWTNLEMIITKMTVDDLTKIMKKLHAFFDEQIKNSRMMWVTELEQQRRDAQNRRLSLTFEKDSTANIQNNMIPQTASVSSFGSTISEAMSSTATSTVPIDHYLDRHWHRVLDMITNIQMTKAFFPLPGTSEGITLTGGTIEFEAKSISLACMNGEMSAPSWALFHMREASIDVRNTAKYTYLDDEHSVVGINMEQKFMFKLGSANLNNQTEAHDSKAVVCRVQHGRHFMIRNNASIEMWLDSMIGDPLRHLNFFDGTKDSPKHSHNVLELFQFPALEAILTTIQNQGNEPASDPMEIVKSSFVCEFHSAVCVQTDFNAQVGFLPDLLKSYTHSPSDGPLISEAKDSKIQRAKELNPLDPDEKRDPRKYECLRWIVDPKIRFIDRFKWNPPVIDEILRKLQIFDHRTTIPKVMQRGVLDRCDALLAGLLENVVIKLALKE